MAWKSSIVVAVGLATIALTLGSVSVVSGEGEQVPRWPGGWDTQAELMIEPRTDASVAVASGIPHGVVVWGGVAEDGRLLNDGVLIDSRQADRWRVMPRAPLVARRDFGWASWADAVYVWGGVDQVGEPLADGAEFQHGWTTLPSSLLPAGPASMTVVDNRLWVVAAHPGSGDARVQSIAVPLEDDRGWGILAEVPLPVGERYVVVGCCGDEADQLIVISVANDRSAVAASWDIRAARNPSFIGGEWTQLGPVPAPVAGPVTGRAIEQELAVWASAADGDPSGTGETGAFAVVQPVGYGAGDGWRTPSAPDGLDATSGLVLSPSHLISVSDLAAYDLAAERWQRLPRLPGSASFGTPSGAATWWDQGRLWVLGGVAPDGTMRSDLRTFEPRLPRGTYALPIGWSSLWRGNDGRCYYVGRPGAWELRGDRHAQPRVWMQQGRRREALAFPDGWHANFSPRLTITDSTGTVRYREGEVCQGDTGTGG